MEKVVRVSGGEIVVFESDLSKIILRSADYHRLTLVQSPQIVVAIPAYLPEKENWMEQPICFIFGESDTGLTVDDIRTIKMGFAMMVNSKKALQGV